MNERKKTERFQVIETPAGERMFVVSEREYGRMARLNRTGEYVVAGGPKRPLRSSGSSIHHVSASREVDAEMSEDVAAYDEAKRRLAVGEDEAVPAAVVNRLLNDEAPIKVWREYRGMKQKELAAALDVTPAYFNLVENRKKDGSIRLFRRMADILKVDIDDLFPPDPEEATASTD